MKMSAIIALCFFMVACGDGSDHSRSYVISQSSVPVEEAPPDGS